MKQIQPAAEHSSASSFRFAAVAPVLPGLVLTAAIAATAIAIRNLTGWMALSPLILSILIGILIRNGATVPAATQAGITFSLKRILRFGIILLGLQVTAAQILSLGGGGLAMVALTLAATFVAIRIAGRMMGVDRSLTDLIAAGTSVCGASAVIAANTVIRGKQEHVAYAVACVTLFGSLSMLVYPLLAAPLGLDARGFGLWTGTTIHEVAQVVAAAFQGGDVAGQFGTISKLARVVMLAPLVMTLALAMRSGPAGAAKGAIPMPWFVLGFVGMMLFNSAVPIPAGISQALATATAFLLSMALAAMGLHTDIGNLKAEGWRPLALGAFGWLFIAIFGYAMLKLFAF
ncbi:putative integral membrane protein (TIGR00698 family) [Neorhizobium sp. R1-B]|uniref:YeiH family protein n=1 Tax=Neorhizobium TaxID=1525371 RepID=UPI000CF85494|nr:MULTISPECIES: putative sulfate exporter family transporter [Neorhizobium]TCV74582.1 putative integral membrane protein (TIGR00698 family) [Neorhizobium sp. S3-V5DH]TDX87769.1 putative integral membrane protein (TIGR00698 family) [Neorhizobium sp. R1-B]